MTYIALGLTTIMAILFAVAHEEAEDRKISPSFASTQERERRPERH